MTGVVNPSLCSGW